MVRFEKPKSSWKKSKNNGKPAGSGGNNRIPFLAISILQDSVLTEFDEDLWIAVIDKARF
jgi:hypothetical protein